LGDGFGEGFRKGGLLLGVNDPLEFGGVDHKAEFEQDGGSDVGAGEGEVVPEDAVGGAIARFYQVVVEEDGEAMRLGVIPEHADTCGVFGIAVVGEGVVVDAEGEGGFEVLDHVGAIVRPQVDVVVAGHDDGGSPLLQAIAQQPTHH